MSLQTTAAFSGGWIAGYLYPATATEILKYVNQKNGRGRLGAKPGFSFLDSVLSGPTCPNHRSEKVDVDILGFLWIGPWVPKDHENYGLGFTH